MDSLYFATPSHKGSSQDCVNWVSRLIAGMGIEAKVGVVTNCPWIDVARSSLVAEFLRTDCGHLLFRDDDIDFDGSVLRRMLDLKTDIAAAPYRMRTPPHAWALRTDERGFVYPGLGCCLISRRVLTGLVDAHPELEYDNDGKKLVALFLHRFIDEDGVQKLLKEDHAFFYRAQTQGFKVDLLVGAEVRHGGVAATF